MNISIFHTGNIASGQAALCAGARAGRKVTIASRNLAKALSVAACPLRAI